MKTSISMLVVGLISFLSFAQAPNNQGSLVELDNVVVTAINTSYLTAVQNQDTPKEVALLQQEAAQYDVQSIPSFSKDVTTDDTFEIVFKNSKGFLNAFYDASGTIDASYERFRDIMLPRSIQRKIFDSHQGWTMTGNLYASAYEGGDLINRSYKIQLEKGDDKKRIMIHVQ